MSKGKLLQLLGMIILNIVTTGRASAQESSWTKIYDNYYLSSVETSPWGLLLGENDARIWVKPFNGIYLSTDLGNSWETFGLKDKGITNIKYIDNKILATTYYHTDTPAGLYMSKNKGSTWEHLGPPYSSNCVEIKGTNIFLGTTAHGVYLSTDSGENWEQKTEEIEIKQIQIEEDKIIAFGNAKTLESTDNGNTWETIPYRLPQIKETYKTKVYQTTSTDITENNITTSFGNKPIDMSVVYTEQPILYAISNEVGLYKYNIPKPTLETEPFLRVPWDYIKENELIDKITAYFDHEYPLLGNIKAAEGFPESETTLNFLGMKEKIPKVYYSSHNGTDYGLPYGTPLYATAGGTAKYFWCYDCGNSIEITHPNGYKSIYMHLQEQIEIPKDTSTQVYEGQHLGKVGMSGKTTGPHLHLSIKKDNILTDPYGWQAEDMPDPWETFNQGNTSGIPSKYLWKNVLQTISGLINPRENTKVTLENKSVSLERTLLNVGFTIYLQNYIRPYKQQGLKYIENTSLLINAIDLVGSIVKELPNKAKITYMLQEELLKETVKIYSLDETTLKWLPLTTYIDTTNKEIYAYTDHFSRFAVFEESYENIQGFTDKAVIKNAKITMQ